MSSIVLKLLVIILEIDNFKCHLIFDCKTKHEQEFQLRPNTRNYKKCFFSGEPITKQFARNDRNKFSSKKREKYSQEKALKMSGQLFLSG